MLTRVDEILATGQYTDRRGRVWHYDAKHRFWLSTPPLGSKWRAWQFDGPLAGDDMRLLIERDQHRNVCEGISGCEDHPVPHVYQIPEISMWIAHPGPRRTDGPFVIGWYRTQAEAMDAAQAVAVKP